MALKDAQGSNYLGMKKHPGSNYLGMKKNIFNHPLIL